MDKKQKEIMLLSELGQMFLVTGKKADKETLQAYLIYLRRYAQQEGHTFEEIIEAIQKAGSSIKYTPKLSDITEFLKPSQEEIENKVLDMASTIVKSYKRKLAEGRGDKPHFENPIMQQAFNVAMERDWDNQLDFDRYFSLTVKNALKTLSNASDSTRRLMLQEAKEKRERAEFYTLREENKQND